MGIILTTSCKTVPNEMGGEFAGQIYALTNTISNFAGFVTPLLAGKLLNSGPIFAIETWYYVFLIAAGALILGTIVFYTGDYGLMECCENQDYEEVKTGSEKEEPETIEIFEDRDDVLVLSLK